MNRTSNIWESGFNNEQVDDYIASPILYYKDNVTFDVIETGPSGLGYNGTYPKSAAQLKMMLYIYIYNKIWICPLDVIILKYCNFRICT